MIAAVDAMAGDPANSRARISFFIAISFICDAHRRHLAVCAQSCLLLLHAVHIVASIIHFVVRLNFPT